MSHFFLVFLKLKLYAVQFHLFVTCVLFLSREGFRRASMRADIRWYRSISITPFYTHICHMKTCWLQERETIFCSEEDAITGENTTKLLKLAWITLPWGIIITISGCIFVFWTQGLSFSNPYGQAILINGIISEWLNEFKFLKLSTLWN